jgi:hypothetical protein
MRYIRRYNRAPKPIKWSYRDPSHRIKPNTISAVMSVKWWKSIWHQHSTSERLIMQSLCGLRLRVTIGQGLPADQAAQRDLAAAQ